MNRFYNELTDKLGRYLEFVLPFKKAFNQKSGIKQNESSLTYRFPFLKWQLYLG